MPTQKEEVKKEEKAPVKKEDQVKAPEAVKPKKWKNNKKPADMPKGK